LPNEDGCIPVACSGDTGWQGSGLQMTYTLQDGQTTMCGSLMKKLLCISIIQNCIIHVMILRKNLGELFTPPKYWCPQNWNESSKAMKPNGIVECIKNMEIWDCMVENIHQQ